MQKAVDVIIMGASVAGSSLAIQLSNFGHKVLLIDKAKFPRSKPCGEALSGLGLNALRKINLEKVLRANESVELSGYKLNYAGKFINIKESTGLGVKRSILDTILVEQAINSANTDVKLDVNTKNLKFKDQIWELDLDDQIYYGKYLVLAAGADSSIYNLLDIKTSNKNLKQRFGVSCTWVTPEQFNKKNVEIYLESGFEFILTPVSNFEFNISILISNNHQRKTKNELKSLIEKKMRRIGITGKINSEIEGRKISAGIRRSAIQKNNLLMLGDACEQLDPVGGMGMTHALLSAELLANTLNQVLERPAQAIKIFNKYVNDREKIVRPLRGFTSATYWMMVLHRNLFFIFPKISQKIGGLFTKSLQTSSDLSWSSLLILYFFKFLGIQ